LGTRGRHRRTEVDGYHETCFPCLPPLSSVLFSPPCKTFPCLPVPLSQLPFGFPTFWNIIMLSRRAASCLSSPETVEAVRSVLPSQQSIPPDRKGIAFLVPSLRLGTHLSARLCRSGLPHPPPGSSRRYRNILTFMPDPQRLPPDVHLAAPRTRASPYHFITPHNGTFQPPSPHSPPGSLLCIPARYDGYVEGDLRRWGLAPGLFYLVSRRIFALRAGMRRLPPRKARQLVGIAIICYQGG